MFWFLSFSFALARLLPLTLLVSIQLLTVIQSKKLMELNLMITLSLNISIILLKIMIVVLPNNITIKVLSNASVKNKLMIKVTKNPD